MTIHPDFFALADLVQAAPELAAHLVKDRAACAAIDAMLERAFQAGRMRERLAGPDRNIAYRRVRRAKIRRDFPVSVLPGWLTAF